MSDEVTRLVTLWQEQFNQGHDKSVDELFADHAELAEFFHHNSAARDLARDRIDKQRDFNNRMNDDSTVRMWQTGDQPLSGYTLAERLGRGGAGEVWKAFGPGGRPVALKRVCLNRKLGKKEKDTLEMTRDMANHVHILEVHGFWELNDELIIASTLASGSLKDELTKTPHGLPLHKLSRYMIEAANGLDYLNQSGIQHRDIKPANLLLVGDSVVIGDLGLLKAISESVVSHSGAGTPIYLPPEVYDGHLTNKSDQYSLALTYIELRTGALSTPVVFDEHDLTEAEILALRKALDADPAKRFASSTEFVKALRISRESIELGDNPTVAVAGKLHFDSLVERKASGFVGREWLATRLDNFVSRNSCGYFEIRGEPGIGKTAFTSWLVQSRGYVHHFNDATQGIVTLRQFIRNFSARLIERYCPNESEPTDSQCQDGAYLQHLLDHVSNHLMPGDKTVLIVDGLDEADRPGTVAGNVLALPPALPQGIFILMTLRELDGFPLMLDEPFERFVLRAESAENMADIRLLLRSKLDQPALHKRVQDAGMTTKSFLDLMVNRSEGNFMYLRYVLPAIERASCELELTELPQGLSGYYERHLRQMRGHDRTRWNQYLYPIICVLAAAKEPLNVAEITDFVKLHYPDIATLRRHMVRDIVREWREFLDETISDGEVCFRIYHTSFREFLEERVDFEE